MCSVSSVLGVGFKSVFLVTNYAMIFSGPLALAFGSRDTLKVPTALDFLMPQVVTHAYETRGAEKQALITSPWFGAAGGICECCARRAA